MKRISRLAVSAALSAGAIVGTGGVALASGHGNPNGKGATHKPSPTALAGTVSCNVHGAIVIGTNGYVRIHALLTPKKGAACTLNGSSGEKAPRTGVLNFSVGSRSTTTTTAASTPVCPTLPSLSGGTGTVMWQPRAKVARTVFTLSTGEITSSTNLALSFEGTTDASTSFSFASAGVSLTLTSRATAAALDNRCGGEFWVIPFTGTATL